MANAPDPRFLPSRTPLWWTAFVLLAIAVVALAFLNWRARSGRPEGERPMDTPADVTVPPPVAIRSLSPAAAATQAVAAAVGVGAVAAEALIRQLLDAVQPLNARRQAARALARLGSDEALTALKAALRDGPPYLKAAIAEGLGESPHREARRMLLELLDDRDEVTARGAVRGLAAVGDAGAADVLANLLFNAQKPEGLRTEAALALGSVTEPAALDTLKRAVAELKDETLVESALSGLGQRPFTETQEFFRNYLESSQAPAGLRAHALEALANAPGDTGPLLLQYASHPQKEIREAAAWALGATDAAGSFGAELLGLLGQETDGSVRARLYQALQNQDSWDAVQVVALVQAESQSEPRMAAFNLLAGAGQSGVAPTVREFFDQTAVPELAAAALQADSLPSRLSAVLALRRSGTPAARSALQQIAGTATDRQVVEAAQAAFQRPAGK